MKAEKYVNYLRIRENSIMQNNPVTFISKELHSQNSNDIESCYI